MISSKWKNYFVRSTSSIFYSKINSTWTHSTSLIRGFCNLKSFEMGLRTSVKLVWFWIFHWIKGWICRWIWEHSFIRGHTCTVNSCSQWSDPAIDPLDYPIDWLKRSVATIHDYRNLALFPFVAICRIFCATWDFRSSKATERQMAEAATARWLPRRLPLRTISSFLPRRRLLLPLYPWRSR